MKIIDWEVNQETVSYTSVTVQHLKKEYPDAILYWIIGTDQLVCLSKWHEINELANEIEFIIVNRSGHRYREPEYIENLKLHLIKNRVHKISSTEIRKKLKKQPDNKGFSSEKSLRIHTSERFI